MKICVALVLIGLVGCSNANSTNTAGSACNLTASPNACQRCWAEQCPTQLDYCYGPGFHAGALIAANQSNATVPCAGFGVCVQTCGCYDNCFDSCLSDLTNDCRDCQQKYFAACRDEKCAAACRLADGGS
jgi:hypothetical protein